MPGNRIKYRRMSIKKGPRCAITGAARNLAAISSLFLLLALRDAALLVVACHAALRGSTCGAAGCAPSRSTGGAASRSTCGAAGGGSSRSPCTGADCGVGNACSSAGGRGSTVPAASSEPPRHLSRRLGSQLLRLGEPHDLSLQRGSDPYWQLEHAPPEEA